jgi:hypothetical protein
MVSRGGRHLESENIGRIDVRRSIRARRLDLERFRSHRTRAFPRCQRVSFGKAAPADNAGTAFDMRESASQEQARRPATAPQRQSVSAE